MSKLQGKVALVTGAATGIGRSSAVALAKEGATVILTDINQAEAEKTLNLIEAAGGKAKFHSLDVSNKAQIFEVINNIKTQEGKLDIALNNAGIGGTPAIMHEMTTDAWDLMMAINLTGVMYCMQAELAAMLENGSGKIVNISSVAGLNGMPYGSAYAAAKHGVIGLTKSAAIEYGNKNIRVNAICPGFIETPIIEGVPDKILEFSSQYRVPMKRIGQPEEVAQAVVWLLSDESSYINGHSLIIDGGFKAA